MHDTILIADLEAAINYWREHHAGLTQCGTLSAPLQALAQAYGRAAFARADAVAWDTLDVQAQQAWLRWYATTPDTPCIAICSTSQGDAVCKGCGRTFAEVQHWPGMSACAKRAVWHRITCQATALRFTTYAERA